MMIRKLHLTLLIGAISVLTYAQEFNTTLDTKVLSSATLLDIESVHLIAVRNTLLLKNNVFSYDSKKIMACDHSLDHRVSLPTDAISLLDIISSDEGADFNCSGGFCLNRFHFHKKGLTLKRQLFDYFVQISC